MSGDVCSGWRLCQANFDALYTVHRPSSHKEASPCKMKGGPKRVTEIVERGMVDEEVSRRDERGLWTELGGHDQCGRPAVVTTCGDKLS